MPWRQMGISRMGVTGAGGGGCLYSPRILHFATDRVGLRAAVQELVRNKILSSHPNLWDQKPSSSKGPW